jgi:hypothetical protein
LTWLPLASTPSHRSVLHGDSSALERSFQLRAEAKVRGSLDEMQARLAKLETPPRFKAAI